MSDQKKPTIMLSAGGTGGHIFPAEALAEELRLRGYPQVLVTDKRGYSFQNIGDEITTERIYAATLKPGIFSKIKAVCCMGAGIAQAFYLLKRHKPGVVVGFGGYPSFPALFVAQVLGIPTILHEQNAVLGKANKWLAGKADTIATSLPDTKSIPDQNKTVLTGNPVRPEFCQARDNTYPALDKNGRFKILVMGGSQGASVFSRVIPGALSKLPTNLKNRIEITQQCREENIHATRARFEHAGIRAKLSVFFTDVPKLLSECHLYIGRAGASSVAEIAVIGRPAIFVPYPGHADQQQKVNADVIANNGGGWVMMEDDFTAQALCKQLQSFMQQPDILTKAADAAHDCGQLDAAQKLADVVTNALQKHLAKNSNPEKNKADLEAAA